MQEVKFLTSADAHMRIDGGIGLYQNIPVRIVLDGPYTHLYDLTGRNWTDSKITTFNDQELVTHSLNMGYCDVAWTRRVYEDPNNLSSKRSLKTTNTVAFFARASHRKQKSVIHPCNTSVSLPEQISGGAWLEGAHNYMYSPAFGNMLIGQFSTDRDFSKLDLYEGRALSRNFAVLQIEEKQVLLFNEAVIGTREDYSQGFRIILDYNNSLMAARLAKVGVSVG